MALSCDICGGSVTGVGGGIFVCDVCGTRYNTDWARAQVGAGAPKAVDAPQTAGTPKTTGLTRPAKPEPRRKKFAAWWFHDKFIWVRVNEDGTVSGECNHKDIGTLDGCESVPGWKNIVALDIIGHQIAGLKADGTLVRAAFGDVEDDYPSLASCGDIVSFSGTELCFAGVRSDGTVDAGGVCSENVANSVDAVRNWTNIVATACGQSAAIIGLKADGTVVSSWPPHNEGFLSSWRDIVSVYAQEGYIIGLKSDGTVVGNYEYDISHWRDIVSIVIAYNGVLGLKADGTTVFCCDRPLETEISDWKDIVAIDTDFHRFYALTAEGKVLYKRV